MSYELAKQLKDAGFTQFGDGYALILHTRLPESDQTMSVIPWNVYIYQTAEGMKKEALYSPTLSELIRECGDNFHSVVMIAYDAWKAFNDGDDFHTVIVEGGTTPEEAVARLWLALNRK